MARHQHTPRLAATEEAAIVLFCIVDDAYDTLNPKGRLYESLRRLSEVVTLALLHMLPIRRRA